MNLENTGVFVLLCFVKIDFYFVYDWFACTYVCAPCVCLVLMETKREPLRLLEPDGCKVPYGYLELNQCPV